MACSCHQVLGEKDGLEAPENQAGREYRVLHQFPEDHEDRVFLWGLALLSVPVTLEDRLALDDRECLLQQALILVLLFVPFFLYQNWYFHFQVFVDRQGSTLQEGSQGQRSSALPDTVSCHREWLHCRRHRSGMH